MPALLARDPESRGDLIAWWEGETIESDAQAICEPDEMIVFLDDDEVVATLGPGRHSLASGPPALAPHLVGGDEIAVAFVTTRTTRLEAEGTLEELDNEGAEDVEPAVIFQ